MQERSLSSLPKHGANVNEGRKERQPCSTKGKMVLSSNALGAQRNDGMQQSQVSSSHGVTEVRHSQQGLHNIGMTHAGKYG